MSLIKAFVSGWIASLIISLSQLIIIVNGNYIKAKGLSIENSVHASYVVRDPTDTVGRITLVRLGLVK